MPHIIIGCCLLSKRSIHEIKFDTTMTKQFIDWLKREKIFIESDSLGITKTMTIGYLTKLHPRITNRTTLKAFLSNELTDIVINPNLAIELDPSLKQQQIDAMSNGDMFIPGVPPFEIYQTELNYGRNKTKVSTDILGIKCVVDKGRLLKEFLMQLGTLLELKMHLSVFLPTKAIHMIGLDAYTKLLCNHNAFLQSVTTVPVGDFQHETLEIPFSTETNTDIDETTLYDMIVLQPWCLSLKQTTTKNKILNVMTKDQVMAACEWLTILFQHSISKILLTKLMLQCSSSYPMPT